MENNWSLYVHIVPKELTGLSHDKYYVGITGRDPEKRWLSNGHGYHKKKLKFWEDIKKYGWKNIHHVVILTGLTEEHALELERLYIQIFRSNDSEYGYNGNNGGFGGNVKPLVPVVQYDSDGNYIKTWDSCAEACRALGVNRSVIAHALKENNRRVKGYQFRYVGEPAPSSYKKMTGYNNRGPRPNMQGKNSPHAKKVVLLNTGEIFDCVSDAAKIKGGNKTGISRVCRNKKGSSGRDENRMRLVWRFYSEYIDLTQEEIAKIVTEAQHPYS